MAIWTSRNGKWEVQKVNFGEYTSDAVVLDNVTNKKKLTMIEHIRVGDSLISGVDAKEDSDSVIFGHDLPKYVMDKLMELRKEDMRDEK